MSRPVTTRIRVLGYGVGWGAKGSGKDIPEEAPRCTFPALSSAALGAAGPQPPGAGGTGEEQMRFRVGKLGVSPFDLFGRF